MMGWAAFGVMLVVAVVLAGALKRRNDEEIRALSEKSSAEITELKAEARGRVDRIEREADRSKLDARDKLLAEIFPALDSLILARDQQKDEELRRGLDLVVADFRRTLEKHGVVVIAPVASDVFDPEVHEAVETMQSDELPPGAVGRCHRVGWRTDERVLRPALVGVVRAAAVETVAQPEPAQSSAHD